MSKIRTTAIGTFLIGVLREEGFSDELNKADAALERVRERLLEEHVVQCRCYCRANPDGLFRNRFRQRAQRSTSPGTTCTDRPDGERRGQFIEEVSSDSANLRVSVAGAAGEETLEGTRKGVLYTRVDRRITVSFRMPEKEVTQQMWHAIMRTTVEAQADDDEFVAQGISSFLRCLQKASAFTPGDRQQRCSECRDPALPLAGESPINCMLPNSSWGTATVLRQEPNAACCGEDNGARGSLLRDGPSFRTGS